MLVLTGILRRSAWKYQARAHRHLFWDAGTMLANLLALASSEGTEARLLTGFVDAQVEQLVGAGGEREWPLALLALGKAAPAPPCGELKALRLEAAPLSRREVPTQAPPPSSRLASRRLRRRPAVPRAGERPSIPPSV